MNNKHQAIIRPEKLEAAIKKIEDIKLKEGNISFALFSHMFKGSKTWTNMNAYEKKNIWKQKDVLDAMETIMKNGDVTAANLSEQMNSEEPLFKTINNNEDVNKLLDEYFPTNNGDEKSDGEEAGNNDQTIRKIFDNELGAEIAADANADEKNTVFLLKDQKLHDLNEPVIIQIGKDSPDDSIKTDGAKKGDKVDDEKVFEKKLEAKAMEQIRKMFEARKPEFIRTINHMTKLASLGEKDITKKLMDVLEDDIEATFIFGMIGMLAQKYVVPIETLISYACYLTGTPMPVSNPAPNETTKDIIPAPKIIPFPETKREEPEVKQEGGWLFKEYYAGAERRKSLITC